MATLKQTPGPLRQCTIGDKSFIDNRTSTVISDWSGIEIQIDDFRDHIDAATDPKTKGIFTSSSFPIQEIALLIKENPDCEYIRIFNGFDASEKHKTFLTAITGDFKSIINRPTGAVIEACCQCKPCKISDPTG